MSESMRHAARDADEMRMSREADGVRYYNFACPACGEAGELGLNKGEQGQFGCPTGCGASFIEYQEPERVYDPTTQPFDDPLRHAPLPGNDWRLRCVVRPVFEGQAL